MNENNIQAPIPQKREKKKRKFNVIDGLIILMVLAIIGTLVYIFLPMSAVKNLTADKTMDIQYTLEIIGVEEKYLEYIYEDCAVLDSTRKSNLGTVIAVDDKSTPYTQLVLSEDGTGVVTPIKGKYNVRVTINATASFSEGEGYAVNGTRIAVGEKINVRFPQFVCEAYCISVPRD